MGLSRKYRSGLRERGAFQELATQSEVVRATEGGLPCICSC